MPWLVGGFTLITKNPFGAKGGVLTANQKPYNFVMNMVVSSGHVLDDDVAIKDARPFGNIFSTKKVGAKGGERGNMWIPGGMCSSLRFFFFFCFSRCIRISTATFSL